MQAGEVLLKGLQVLRPFLAGLWVLGLIFQVLMIANRKPGVRLFDQRLMYNPFSVQFYGDQYLTVRGLFWRNLSWICYIVFAVVLLLLFGAYYMVRNSGAS